MRNLLVCFAVLLFGCSSDGDGLGSSLPVPSELQHAPEITDLVLSPTSAMHREGDGSVTLTVQVTVRDAGEDLQTLFAKLPDGTIIEFGERIDAEKGLLIESFQMSTASVGAFLIDFWLQDEAGDSSSHRSIRFIVDGDIKTGDWTGRLVGLPFVLNDVTWDGSKFIAVGDAGEILESADGISWVEQESFSDAQLLAVASDGTDIFVVGTDATVLHSADGGDTWSLKYTEPGVLLSAVTIAESHIVVGGMDGETGEAVMLRSVDGGESWTAVASLLQSGHFVTDLVNADGIFVAGTDTFDWGNDARVLMSLDGNVWHDIILRETIAASYAVLHDGGQFIAAGSQSTVFASADGVNWTELQTPVDGVDYQSAASNGIELVVAGGISWWYWWMNTAPMERPVGISSTDGGVTWQAFDIDGYYQSNGLAWGNGRFVSVGQTSTVSGLGAIYTTE